MLRFRGHTHHCKHTQQAQTKLQNSVATLYSCFVGGTIWDRLLHHRSLVITTKEKEELFRACEIQDVSDLDPSLSRLGSLHVPTQTLVESLERINPSRIRFLPSSGEEQTEIIIIRQKQMIHIVNDELKNSFSVFSCLRKPLHPHEVEALNISTMQHCSQLISHLCYILWTTLVTEKI